MYVPLHICHVHTRLPLQIPFSSYAVELQTAVVAFLLSRSEAECKMLVDTNEDFAAFARQAEVNYNLWKLEGSSVACHDFCNNLVGVAGKRCMQPCAVLLPIVWRAYGKPWQEACIMHRVTFGVRPA